MVAKKNERIQLEICNSDFTFKYAIRLTYLTLKKKTRLSG